MFALPDVNCYIQIPCCDVAESSVMHHISNTMLEIKNPFPAVISFHICLFRKCIHVLLISKKIPIAGCKGQVFLLPKTKILK